MRNILLFTLAQLTQPLWVSPRFWWIRHLSLLLYTKSVGLSQRRGVWKYIHVCLQLPTPLIQLTKEWYKVERPARWRLGDLYILRYSDNKVYLVLIGVTSAFCPHRVQQNKLRFRYSKLLLLEKNSYISTMC